MRLVLVSLCCLSGVIACSSQEPNPQLPSDYCSHIDMKTTPPADMSVPPPCAAAQGLVGDNLICTDFPTTQTLIDLRNMGWDFTSQCPAGWTVINKQLQVSNFSSFMGSCIFTMPSLSAAVYQKYSSFTLAVSQTVDINSAKQTAYIYFSLDIATQQLWSTSGTYPQIVTTLQVTKASLPNGGNNSYQPLFKLTSAGMAGTLNMGWQISSIAVMGNP